MHSDRKLRSTVSALVLALLLTELNGCAPLATVKYTAPRPTVTRETDAEMIEAESYLTNGQRLEHAEPLSALGEYLAGARLTSRRIERQPTDTAARDLYNFSVARSVGIIETAPLDPWSRSLSAPGPDGEYILTTVRHRGRDRNPAEYKFTPTDTLRVGGSFFPKPTIVQGIGAPLVAVRRQEQHDSRKSFAPQRVYGTATALIEFNDHRARLDLVDRLTTERIELGGREFQLAADFSTPIAFAMASEHPEKLGFVRLITPEKYSDTAQLVRLQPYDPNRTPVIFVHGLQDTPTSWVPMIKTLVADPEIRRRYQFWVYSYPSGYPYPYSAMLLRHDLDGIASAFPDHKRVVLVGHSMGGMLCRLMVTDAGDRIWREFFRTAPAKTPLSREARDVLEKTFIFNHRHDVKRVVFISTPHRGSKIASWWIGRLASGIIKRPPVLSWLWTSTKQIQIADPAAAPLKRAPDSIDTLEPNDRFVLAVNKLPLTPEIPYHSIIGDRGRGDTPNSSDGVVPYWSSHLDGAKSELIVPSGHGAQYTPQAIREVERILKTYP